MTDFIIVAILAVIIGSAARYVYKAKKSGAKCIGCAVEGSCPSKSGQACGCGCSETTACDCHADAK